MSGEQKGCFMKMNLSIKINSDNLSISDALELILSFNEIKGDKNSAIVYHNGFKFEISAKVELSINYEINEIS